MSSFVKRKKKKKKTNELKKAKRLEWNKVKERITE